MNGVRNQAPNRNVADFLEDSGTDHRIVHHAALAGPVRSPEDVSRLLGIDVDRIAKTLLIVDLPDRRHSALAVLPVGRRLALSVAAQALGWNGAALASPVELAERLGQPTGGVSPLGAPSGVAVLIDRSLDTGATVLVGGGAVGIEVELSPGDLVLATRATVAELGEDP